MSGPPRRGRRKTGRLTPEDRAVWEIVARQVRRIGRGAKQQVPEAETEAEPGADAAPRPGDRGVVPDQRGTASAAALFAGAEDAVAGAGAGAGASLGEGRRAAAPAMGPSVTFDLHDPAPLPVGRPEAGLDRRTAERLRKGERAPDARIDLHGMTAERAHQALDRFIIDAAARGLRCVLVITGKGGRRGAEHDAGFMRPDRGVLRQDAPRWLRAGPAARDIIGIYEAHRRHGGAGAFYVYLKKRR